MILRLSLITILAPFFFFLQGQQLYQKYYNLNSGFPHPQVWDMLQDDDGYMWFATAGGLARYDGIEYLWYTKEDGLPNSVIRSISYVDRRIWATTDDGVSVFDGRTFKNFPKDTLGGTIWKITKDRLGRLWFPSEVGLAMMSADTIKKYFNDSLTHPFHDSYMDRRGNMWFSGRDGIAFLGFENNAYSSEFRFLSRREGYLGGSVRECEEDVEGNLLFATDSGLVLLSTDKFLKDIGNPRKYFNSILTAKTGLRNAGINTFCVAKDSTIWLATELGFARFKNGVCENFLTDENFSSNRCQRIYQDREEIIWIGTDGGGLVKIPNQRIYNFTMKEGLVYNVVNAVTGDGQGRVFIATDNGVSQWDGHRMTTITPNHTPGNTVWSLKWIGTSLWLGSDRNLFEFRDGKIIDHPEIYKIANAAILDIEANDNGELWLGTSAGLVILGKKSPQKFMKKDGLPGDQVWSISRGRGNYFWLAIAGGMARADWQNEKITFRSWTTADGLPDNTINVVMEDPVGKVWVGSDIGISLWNGNSFLHWKPKSLGLLDNVVPIIYYVPESKTMWIASRGFAEVRDQGDSLFVERILNKERGILTDEPTTSNAIYKDENHDLWVGTFFGVARIPNEVQRSANVLMPRIESVTVDDSMKTFVLKDPVEANGISGKSIAFQFSAVSYLDEKENIFQYFMEGFDRTWSEWSKKNEVRYTNLAPGDYIFHVRARNAQMNSSETNFVFNVRRPFWLHPIFVMVIAVLAFFAAQGIYRFRVNRKMENVRGRNRQLEKAVDERTLQISHQKEELEKAFEALKKTQSQLVQSEKMSSLGQLVAGVAHEINNPVTVLTGNITYIEEYIGTIRKLIAHYEVVAKDHEEETRQVKATLDFDFINADLDNLLVSVKHANERIHHMVQDLRVFSRLDEADLYEADIHESIETTLKIFMSQYKHRLAIEKDYKASNKIYCFVNQINQVLLNILMNSAQALETKFPGANGQGQIIIETQNTDADGIVVRFRDNGPGIPEAIMSKIFDPFFTTKPVGQGTGLGLSITYSIVEKHSGSIACTSRIGEWTEFVITLPKKPKVKINT